MPSPHNDRAKRLLELYEYAVKKLSPEEAVSPYAFNALMNYATINQGMSERVARGYAQTTQARLISHFLKSSQNTSWKSGLGNTSERAEPSESTTRSGS